MIFADSPLKHEPETKYLYTTYGYTLAGRVMEVASEQSFMDLLKATVLVPAGMKNTRDDSHFAIIPNRAQGYRLANGELQNSGMASTSYKIPGGGLCGTAPDLARFAIALMKGTLISEVSRETMWTVGKLKDGSATDYGLGWKVAEYEGVKEVTHGGAQQRVSTFLYLCPKKGLAVAVL